MERTLLLATFNQHKAAEIRAILPRLTLALKCLADLPGAEPPPEDGLTLEENAAHKAAAAAAFSGLPSLADDTGLEVDALGGAPGVLSARFAGPGAGAEANNRLLLEKLAGVPPERRGARFACVMALALPSGESFLARGVLEGGIAEAPRGGRGFGYDPLFLVGGGPRTLADLAEAEKNALSHRARALAAILPRLLAL